MTEIISLSPPERALLVKRFNTGVDEAAESLSRLVKQKVTLSVLDIEFQRISQFVRYFDDNCSMCSVNQHMSGPFDAQSMLLFTEQDSLQVVRRMLGSEMSDETLAELHQEALLEIGNIVLNACIGSISTFMETTFNIDPPQFKLGTARYLIPETAAATQDAALLMRISLALSDGTSSGHIVFLLETVSLRQLRSLLQSALKQFSGKNVKT